MIIYKLNMLVVTTISESVNGLAVDIPKPVVHDEPISIQKVYEYIENDDLKHFKHFMSDNYITFDDMHKWRFAGYNYAIPLMHFIVQNCALNIFKYLLNEGFPLDRVDEEENDILRHIINLSTDMWDDTFVSCFSKMCHSISKDLFYDIPKHILKDMPYSILNEISRDMLERCSPLHKYTISKKVEEETFVDTYINPEDIPQGKSVTECKEEKRKEIESCAIKMMKKWYVLYVVQIILDKRCIDLTASDIYYKDAIDVYFLCDSLDLFKCLLKEVGKEYVKTNASSIIFYLFDRFKNHCANNKIINSIVPLIKILFDSGYDVNFEITINPFINPRMGTSTTILPLAVDMYTVLQYCSKTHYTDYLNLVKFILQYSGGTYIKNHTHTCETALELAKQRGYSEIAKLIESFMLPNLIIEDSNGINALHELRQSTIIKCTALELVEEEQQPLLQ